MQTLLGSNHLDRLQALVHRQPLRTWKAGKQSGVPGSMSALRGSGLTKARASGLAMEFQLSFNALSWGGARCQREEDDLSVFPPEF